MYETYSILVPKKKKKFYSICLLRSKTLKITFLTVFKLLNIVSVNIIIYTKRVLFYYQ